MLNTTPSDYPYDESWATQEPGTGDEGICSLDPHPVGTLVQTYVHSFICVFGLLGNLLVIVTYTYYKRSRTMTDLFLLNVALADLLFVATLPLTIYNEQLGWPMATGVCKAARGLYSVNLYAGMLLLACVGGDRYVAIVQARRSFGASSRACAAWPARRCGCWPLPCPSPRSSTRSAWRRRTTCGPRACL